MKRSPMKRTARIKPKRRTPDEFARVYHSEERVAWVQGLRCACGCGGTPCINAHTATGGAGRKAGYESIIPLAPKCHERQHAKGWGAIGLSQAEAQAIARDVQRMWGARDGG